MLRQSELKHQFDNKPLKAVRKQDLRSPAIARLSRGSSIRYSRIVALISLDCILLSLARWLAETYGRDWNPVLNTRENTSLLILIVTLEIGLLAAAGLYKSGHYRRNYAGIVKAITLANVLLLLISFLYFPDELVSRSTFLLSCFLGIVFVWIGHFIADTVIKLIRHRGIIRHPIFVFCRSEDVEKVASLVEQEDYYRFAGWSDLELLEGEHLKATLAQIGNLGVSEVFVCTRSSIQNPMFLYWTLRNAGITLYFLSIELDPLFRESEFSTVGGVPCIRFAPPAITGIDFWMKRVIDFCLAVFVLTLASPLYLAIALLIKLDSPGSIFYRQNRVGLHGHPFKVWKFRTMVVNAEQLQQQLEQQNQTKDGILFKIKADPRITRVGRFLRRYSLDELPQVFNVLLGEMSFVGPRPLPLRDVEKFSEHHFIRHEVLPGISGLWQVSGRSDIDNFEDVLRLDIRYIENWSLWLDLQIILKTFQVILKKTGAY